MALVSFSHLFKLYVVVWIAVSDVIGLENDAKALYPCLQSTEWLRNNTNNVQMPLELRNALSAESSNMKIYIIPIPSVKDLCDYIQKKAAVIFRRLYSINVIAVDIGKKIVKNDTSMHLNRFETLYVLAIEYFKKDAIVLRQMHCRTNNQVFDDKSFECVSVKSNEWQNTIASKGAKNKGLQVLAVVGNIISIISQILFVLLHWKAKTLHDVYPPKCLLFVSAMQGLLHFLQLASLYIHKGTQACTVISISSHWVALCAYVWLNCASFEINWILSERCSVTKDERFTGYSSFAFGLTAVVVLSCTIIHVSSDSVIGYGKGQTCFINDRWNSFYSFLLPISIACLLNIIWTSWTYKGQGIVSSQISSFLSSQAKSLVKRRVNVAMRLTLLSVAIFLTRVVQVFWRFPDYAVPVTEILISLQGIAIFTIMAADKEVLDAVKEIFCTKSDERVTYTYKYRQKATQSNA